MFSTSFTYKGNSITGKETIKSSDSTGKVSECTYDITVTKN
jgi:hypothetical protein